MKYAMYTVSRATALRHSFYRLSLAPSTTPTARLHCRGVACFPEGLPFPENTIRLIWGEGVRAGLYALTPTEAYWYTCFNSPQACPLPVSPEQR